MSACVDPINIISAFVILSLYLSNLHAMKCSGIWIFLVVSGEPQSETKAASASSKNSEPKRSMQRRVADQVCVLTCTEI